MKQITSTEFQKAYPRLTEPHEVTANGRPIGTWIPTRWNNDFSPSGPTPALEDRYDARPVSAAPKPGRKK